MRGSHVLAIDEGSSSARAVIIDADGLVVSEASVQIHPIFPHEGWVELDPKELWTAPREAIERAMVTANLSASDISAVGVTTHRETIVMWDRSTGEPVYNAIMWMSKQTNDIVKEWSDKGLDSEFRRRTGLRNDAFFSASKIVWLLRHIPGVRERAERGELAIGTPDMWLLWNLTGGSSHKAEVSAASRTALFHIERGEWDEEFCEILGIPTSIFPEVSSSNRWFGDVVEGVFPGMLAHPVPIMAILGDQQAGLFGQGCLAEGSAKNTFGTAGVLTVNVGTSPKIMDGLSSSFAWKIDDQVTYEAEGVVFHSGQTIQWLRDGLGMFSYASQSEAMAESVPDNGGVFLVPAFAGLCDPHWDRDAKGMIIGLTLETTAAHVARAGIEAMAFQTRDNVVALGQGGINIEVLKVDGGAVSNDFLCQFQADILGIPVARPVGLERTALGIGHLAGAGVGMWSVADIEGRWQEDRIFEPIIEEDERESLYADWLAAVAACRSIPALQRASRRTMSKPQPARL
jgi:glycerol kinase